MKRKLTMCIPHSASLDEIFIVSGRETTRTVGGRTNELSGLSDAIRERRGSIMSYLHHGRYGPLTGTYVRIEGQPTGKEMLNRDVGCL